MGILEKLSDWYIGHPHDISEDASTYRARIAFEDGMKIGIVLSVTVATAGLGLYTLVTL